MTNDITRLADTMDELSKTDDVQDFFATRKEFDAKVTDELELGTAPNVIRKMIKAKADDASSVKRFNRLVTKYNDRTNTVGESGGGGGVPEQKETVIKAKDAADKASNDNADKPLDVRLTQRAIAMAKSNLKPRLEKLGKTPTDKQVAHAVALAFGWVKDHESELLAEPKPKAETKPKAKSNGTPKVHTGNRIANADKRSLEIIKKSLASDVK